MQRKNNQNDETTIQDKIYDVNLTMKILKESLDYVDSKLKRNFISRLKQEKSALIKTEKKEKQLNLT
jgi:hypothetical protein